MDGVAIQQNVSVSVTIETEHQDWNPLAQNLIAQTKWLTNPHTSDMYYVETPALEGAIERLDRFRVAVLVGLPGDGKTSLGKEILKNYKRRFDITPIQINSPSEWTMIFGTKRDCIVMIDDIFGSTYFEVNRFELWRPYFENIMACLSRNEKVKDNLRVIITSRKDILQESLRYIKSKSFSEETIFADKHIVDLCNFYQLSESLKREMIDRYCFVPGEDGPKRRVTLQESMIKRIIETKTPLGFPYLCQLFFSKQDFFSQGETFFRQPIELLLRNLKHLYDTGRNKYFTLAVVLLNSKDCCLDIRSLNPSSKRKRSNTIGQLAILLDIEKDYIQIVLKCLKVLLGVYLNYNHPMKVYEFSHSSVREAMFISLGKLHQDFLLKKCSLKDLEFLVVSETKKRKLSLANEHSYGLYDRLANDIITFPDETINLSIMNEREFVNNFFNFLSEESRLQTILQTTYSVSESVTSITESQEEFNGHMSSLIFFSYRNPQFLGKLLESRIDLFHSRRWLKREFSATLKKAVQIGNTEVVEMLFRYGAANILSSDLALENEMTRSAMWYDTKEQRKLNDKDLLSSYELVSHLIHDPRPEPLINRGITDPNIDGFVRKYLDDLRTFKEMSLTERMSIMSSACKNGDVNIVKFLEKHGTTIPEDAILTAISPEDANNELLQYLLAEKRWSEDKKTEALDCSCRIGKLDKVHCLIKENASFSNKALFFAAGSVEDSFDLIEYVHQACEWSETQIEDSTSIACMKGNVEIIRYFATVGAKFSDKCLIFATLSPKPLPVLSVISLLKMSWSDSTVNDAMEIACAKLDIDLIECILHCKNLISDRALAIASKSSQDGGLELLSYLLKNYKWSKEQKSLALGVASEHLNITAAEFLINHGASLSESSRNSDASNIQETGELLQQIVEFLSKRTKRVL